MNHMRKKEKRTIHIKDPGVEKWQFGGTGKVEIGRDEREFKGWAEIEVARTLVDLSAYFQGRSTE